MQKKKTYKGLVIFLCAIEIIMGIGITKLFLIPIISNKLILHPIEYSIAVNHVESTTEKSESKQQEALDIESDTSYSEEVSKEDEIVAEVDYSTVTCEVTHDLGNITGSRIGIINAKESSVINQSGHSNTAYEAYDGDLSTSWQEGVSGAGIGSWLYYKLDGKHSISDIVMYVGVWREAEGKDYYHDNYRPKEIEISIGEMKWRVSFDDNKLPQVIHFSDPVPAEEITFTILEAHKTNRYEDLGIAEIAAYEP